MRIIAKGRRETVLPIGAKTARDVDRYIRAREPFALSRRCVTVLG